LVAIAGGNGPGYGLIYTSTDSGNTWFQKTNAPSQSWQAIASSSDGKMLTVFEWNGPAYASTDSGETWILNSIPGKWWQSVACSADGSKMVALAFNDGIYASHTTPSPQLNITASNTNLAFSWTAPSINFVMQQNIDLTTSNWVTLTNTPTLNLINLNNELTISPSNSSGFFRLSTP
jgi:photosystem II stability/assembly factor-like uncharacterized protein